MEYPPPSSQPPHSQYPQQPYQQPGYPQQPQYTSQPGYPQYPQQQPMYAPPPIQQVPPPKKKRRALWIIVGIIVFLVVVCGAIGSMASHSNTGTVVATNDTTAQQSGTTPTASVQHFKVGQVVRTGDTFEVTVNSVTLNATGDTVSQPKSGDQFMLIDVSIKNISAQPQSVSSLVQWKLRDATGLAYTEAITDLGQPPDGSIEAGSPIRGVFVYEIPLTVKSFTLSFQANIMDSSETTWDIAV